MEELREMLLPELGKLKQLIVGKEAELAEKDALITELKRLLAEVKTVH